MRGWRLGFLAGWLLWLSSAGAAVPQSAEAPFPRPLESYTTGAGSSLWQVLQARVQAEPLNLVATLIFFLAIVHTFLAPKFLRLAHRLEQRHQAELARSGPLRPVERLPVNFWAELCHFAGEVEAVFGIWVVPLLVAIAVNKGWPAARDYLGHGLNFTEPLFVVVIMTMAASRPVLQFAERVLALGAGLGRGTPAAWWLSILTLGPLLGSLITEPAAMTIAALLLARKIYQLNPSPALAYGTLGLLFVNVSVGGTLTPFAAPPVLMVAGKWGWGLQYMLTHFGWKTVLGVVAANLVYLGIFGKEFKRLASLPVAREESTSAQPLVPVWIVAVHLLFLAWTVFNSHYPALFIGGFLFYLAFTQATEPYQSDLALRPALLVGFFLAGLVVHGALQAWWIQPLLSRFAEVPLFFGALVLTAFNDNAAITYLASLVPGFGAAMKQAVVAGAVVGGGLTVIANAPNPAGQAVLARFFPEGVSPLRLLLGALLPTVLMASLFLLWR